MVPKTTGSPNNRRDFFMSSLRVQHAQASTQIYAGEVHNSSRIKDHTVSLGADINNDITIEGGKESWSTSCLGLSAAILLSIYYWRQLVEPKPADDGGSVVGGKRKDGRG